MQVTSLHIVSLLALSVSALGNSVATSPRVCTITLDDDPDDDDDGVSGKLGNMATNCFGTNIEQQIQESKSLQDHKTLLKNICDMRQQIRECLVEVEIMSELCQNAISHQNFKLLRNLMETPLDSGCIRDGEFLASMAAIYKASPSDPFHSDPFRECVSTGLAREKNLLHYDLTYPSVYYFVYRSANSIADCFGNITEGNVDLATNLKSILTEITHKMKCVHPQDGTIVHCTTIDVTLPDVPKLCPIKSQDDERTPVYDILKKQVGWCIVASNYQRESDRRHFDDIENIDMARAYFKHHCSKKSTIEQCWSDVLALSSVCLNETQENFIKVAVDLWQSTYDYVCMNEGESLGYVINKVMSDKNKTEHSKSALAECERVARRLDVRVFKSLEAALVLLNYQRLKVFKECFIDKMRGDITAVLISLELLNFVERNMKCIDEENGNIVLCETIGNTNKYTHTTNKVKKVCPLVGEHDNVAPKYEMLIDRGFKCSKASTLHLNHLGDLTTIEEFRTFFNKFCQNRQPIKHCFEDLTSLSKICQNETNHQMLSIFTDFLGTILENGCKQNGEVLATILHGFITGTKIDRDQMKTCLDNVAIQMQTISLKSEDLPDQSEATYRTCEAMKGCFVHDNTDAGAYKVTFVSFINDILKDLKCVDPDGGTTVLCKNVILAD